MQEVRERVYNPVQKDYATFLKTSAETNGEYSLLEIELEPEGGNPLHAHSAFTEEFKVIEGELKIQLGEQHLVLRPGETALVPLNTAHRFYNTSDERTIFHVELRPGHQGFEQSVRIAYGTAGVKLGAIKNLLTLGLLIEMSGTKVTELPFVLQPLFRLLASIARRSGLDKELMAQYGQPNP